MRSLRWVGLAAVVLVSVAGCGGSGGAGKPAASVTASVSSKAAVVAPRAALEAYERVSASGCTDAVDCQGFMTRKLAAAVRVRDAMRAKDPGLYAVPIGFVDEAERQADHFGRDNLGAKGNSLAVSLPLQRMVGWFREHPEG